MSYDLVVWEGMRPDCDDGAAEVCARVMDRFEADDGPAAPTPRIRAYVDALLARWPDITDDDDDSPWADGPLIANADGDALYFSLVWSRAEETSEVAATLAARHGLVCFDPQTERLRPQQDVAGGHPPRRWFKRR